MDIKLKKKSWYIRYKYRIAGGAVILAGIVYVIVLASGPRRLRIDIDKIQTSEVTDSDFMEYVDVEGISDERYRRPARRLGKTDDNLPRERA